MHQGTISLMSPDMGFLRDVLLSEQMVLDAMANYTFAPLGAQCSLEVLQKTKRALKKCLKIKIMEKFGCTTYLHGPDFGS